MRITIYKSYINESKLNYLVKESSTNYPYMDSINTPQDLVKIMRDVFHIHELAEEMLYMICLNNKCVPTAFFVIAKGTVNVCYFSAREIFIQALLSSAVQIILCHNHPSGDITPSEADIKWTMTIKEAGKLLNIPLQDHIIIGGYHHFSFKEQEIL